MSLSTLTIENLGPIGHCRVDLGDLTVLIGPQASGKSLLLQTLRRQRTSMTSWRLSSGTGTT